MFFRVLALASVALTAAPAMAEIRSDKEALRIAKQSRMCGDLAILRAEFRRHGNVGVLCDGGITPPADVGEATNFVPLVGGLGPLLGLGGGAVVAGVLGGGSSTSDTQ